MDNYYKILGCKFNANTQKIRQNYLKLIKKYHPDLYSGNKLFAERKSARINIAYSTLSKEFKRSAYDRKLIEYLKHHPQKVVKGSTKIKRTKVVKASFKLKEIGSTKQARPETIKLSRAELLILQTLMIVTMVAIVLLIIAFQNA